MCDLFRTPAMMLVEIYKAGGVIQYVKLGKATKITLGAISQNIHHLEKHKMVTHASSGRNTFYSLTPKGKIISEKLYLLSLLIKEARQ